jgi:hypothetical protein
MRTPIPTMRTLMEDPTYRTYMKRVPPGHTANRAGSGNPWQLWVRVGGGTRWLTRTYPTYRDVWPTFVAKLKADDHDPTITSRRVFYAPPGEWYDQKVRKARRPTPDNPKPSHVVVERRWRQLFFWDSVDLHWCGRCRRPVVWMPLFADHHALRRFPAVTDEDNYRCIICGIRWIAMPDIKHMDRIEQP